MDADRSLDNCLAIVTGLGVLGSIGSGSLGGGDIKGGGMLRRTLGLMQRADREEGGRDMLAESRSPLRNEFAGDNEAGGRGLLELRARCVRCGGSAGEVKLPKRSSDEADEGDFALSSSMIGARSVPKRRR